MYRKMKKLFAVCLTVSMLLTMVLTTTAFAATSLKGTDRYQTALNIVKAGWTSSENAVIARGDDLADALAAAPLAYAKGKAPILLTETSALTTGVMEELTALGVKNVYIVGGTGAVSEAVETALKAKFEVKRLFGADRAATSLAVAEEAFPTAPAKAVLVNGYATADALSISSIAAYNGMPILLADSKDTVATKVAEYLEGKTVYAVGGTGVLSAAVIGSATRLYGADRYATNVAVLKEFALDYSKVFVALGEDANNVDALGGAAFAAVGNNPMVLVNGALTTDAKALLTDKVEGDTVVYTLGGLVPASVATAIEALLPADLRVTSVSATNAKTLVIKFNQPVLEETVVADDDTLVDEAIEVDAIGDAEDVNDLDEASASLSEDGKTLTLVLPLADADYFDGSYAVTVNTTVTDEDENEIVYYSQILTYSDTVRPTVTSVTYPDNNTAKLTFSEPVNFENADLEIKDEDGDVIDSAELIDYADDLKSLTIDISDDDAFVEDDTNTITFIGVEDYAGNLMTPNPTTKNFVKTNADTTDPTVKSIVSENESTVVVTFSEPLRADGDGVYFTINVTGNVTPVDVTGDANDDETEFTVDLAGLEVVAWADGFDGLTKKITVDDYFDLSGNDGASTSKLVEFNADETAPEVKSTRVQTIDDVRYIVVEFDEAVAGLVEGDGGVDLDATYVDDGVETDLTIANSALSLYDKDEDENFDYLLINTEDYDGEGTVLPVGSYTITLPDGIVTDVATAENGFEEADVTVAVGSMSDTAAPDVETVVAANDTVTVTFDEEVTNATGLNVANYTIEGEKVFSSAIFVGDKSVVRLTFKDGVQKYNGNMLFEVKNVKDADGNEMDDYAEVIDFTENVNPVLSTATMYDTDVIKLTFSETIELDSLDVDDFTVEIEGSEVAVTGFETSTGAALTSDAKTIYLQLESGIDSVSDDVTVEIASGSVEDLNGNTNAAKTITVQ